jgi:hypothetical protein
MVPNGFLHWCPACDRTHAVRIGSGHWVFGGNHEKPTFSPSIRVFSEFDAANKRYPMGRTRTLCHYNLIDGFIAYYPDCPHEYAGREVALPELPAWLRE